MWLASYPKSGNTWVRAFLFVLLKLMQGEAVAAVDLNAVAISGQNERTADYYVRHLPDRDAIFDRAAVAAARPKVQTDIAVGMPGPVMIKTHNAMVDYLGAPLVNRAVSAGALYIVRDPLDVAVSLAHFHAISLDAAIERMATPGWSTQTNPEDVYFVTGSWSENVASWTARPNPAVLAVRYEDLIAKPEETFTTLAHHVAMPANPAQIARAIDLTTFERMRSAEAAQGFVEKAPEADVFFRRGKVGEGRERLSAEQVGRIVDTHREQMARFGYLPA